MENFEFYIFENSASLKTYLGHDAVVEVPAFVTATVTDELHETEVTRDLPVEKIGKTAFRGNEEIREVVLPGNRRSHPRRRFQGSGLESLDAPGQPAFHRRTRLCGLPKSNDCQSVGSDRSARRRGD